ncbi:EAL domain-containing protein [Crassaminicella profunda]|uniref:EAL domain-containing protein n=1 Tax=Crassaminicella profunda TaxID=1286698 RepID=UPI001FE7A5CC|nr:EAL domain-containing protein [Crassaminicella profunda]
MKKSKKYIKQNVVNTYKLIYLPLWIALLATFTVSISSFYISKNVLLEQVKQDGLNLVKQAIGQIEGKAVALDVVDEMLEDKIRTAGEMIIAHKEDLDNDYLVQSMKDLHVDELHWMNEKGEGLYSTIEAYRDWVPPKGHPLYDFIHSNDQELMEDIRPDAKFRIPIKYGAIKDKNGYVVQVGILAEHIQELTEQFSYQTLVERLVMEENVVYATLLDDNLKTIADGDIEDIGVIYDHGDEKEVREALKGKTSMIEWYYDKRNAKVLEISAPVFKGRKITGVFVIGLSMKSVYTSIYTIFTTSSIIALIMFLLFLWVQKENVIKPVKQLDKKINQIDLENAIDYRLPLVKKDTFFGLTISMNNLLDKTHSYLEQLKENQEELEASNEEVIAAYHQLAASEEELRAQYDEIQGYAEKVENLKQKYEHLAYNDPLTNLPNRRSFLEKIEKVTNKNQSGAVMLIDLDNFKEINDTLGHAYGDEVLKKVAQGLMHIKDEKIFLSRFGGDEFLILIEDEEDVLAIENYAKKIIHIFKNKWFIEGDEIYISASVGITRYPFDSNRVNQLIMNADMAMYHVKDLGKNNYMFFHKEMTKKLKEQIQIERILREAIKTDGFKLVYQPQIGTYTGKIVSFEALLRLKDHFISPNLFIQVAEENGMIIQMGRWVTREAIHQIATWKEKGLEVKPIAINFSAKQLNDTDYIHFLENTLKEMNVDAKSLEIEITESIFLEKKEETIVFLNQLRNLGIKIALDDFGTGYSSLSYLTFLPVDKIKLDKSLCDKFLEIENIAVMDNIISLAHSLNLEIVAEGIEDMEQYKRLRVAKCNYIQGYLFSKPVEALEAEKIYENNFLKKY